MKLNQATRDTTRQSLVLGCSALAKTMNTRRWYVEANEKARQTR